MTLTEVARIARCSNAKRIELVVEVHGPAGVRRSRIEVAIADLHRLDPNKTLAEQVSRAVNAYGRLEADG